MPADARTGPASDLVFDLVRLSDGRQVDPPVDLVESELRVDTRDGNTPLQDDLFSLPAIIRPSTPMALDATPMMVDDEIR